MKILYSNAVRVSLSDHATAFEYSDFIGSFNHVMYYCAALPVVIDANNININTFRRRA